MNFRRHNSTSNTLPSNCPHTSLTVLSGLCLTTSQASTLEGVFVAWSQSIFYFSLSSPLWHSLSYTFRTEGDRGGRRDKNQEYSYLTTLAHTWQPHPWVWQMFKNNSLIEWLKELLESYHFLHPSHHEPYPNSSSYQGWNGSSGQGMHFL